MYSEKFLKFIEMWRSEFAMDKTIDQKVCVDRDGNPIPWYTYPAIEYLAQFDYGNKKVFEFGCGNSSQWWGKRAGSVVSIEDNADWLSRWQAEFDWDGLPNLEVRHRDEGEGYYNAILEDSAKYDVIVIDGKRRADCARVAMEKLALGGMIILDDSDRINTSYEYVDAVNFLKQGDYIQVDFYGFCPMNNFTKTTSVFLSRDFRFESLYKVQPIFGLGSLWSMRRGDRKKFYKEQM